MKDSQAFAIDLSRCPRVEFIRDHVPQTTKDTAIFMWSKELAIDSSWAGHTFVLSSMVL